MKVRALSGMQPWWWAIVHGAKRIENRDEKSGAHHALKSYRGTFLLHASAGVGSMIEFHTACESIRNIVSAAEWAKLEEHLTIKVRAHTRYWAAKPTLPRGVFVGRCRVSGLIEPTGQPFGDEGKRAVDALVRLHGERALLWHAPGQWGHILADVEPAKHLTPATGALGLWTWDTDTGATEWAGRR
jgi:hypothetical protein